MSDPFFHDQAANMLPMNAKNYVALTKRKEQKSTQWSDHFKDFNIRKADIALIFGSHELL
jgi:hypothetical protein